MAKAAKSAPPAVAAKDNADKKALKKSKKDGEKVASAPVAAKEEKKSKKSKKAKTPTPPPSESSSSESESESESEDDSSSEESSSDEEEAKPAAAAPAAAKEESSDEDSSDESESESDSDEEEAKPAAKAEEKKVEAEEESDSSEDSDSDDSSSDDDEEETPAAKEEPKTNGKRKAEDEEEVAAPAPAKKARAEDEEEASTNVFVGQLSWNVDNDWLKSEFEDCGEVVSARVVFDRDSQRSRGFGYVEFADLESSAKAIEKNGHEVDGRAIRVNYATQRNPQQAVEKRAKAFGDQQSPPAETLFIGSLSFSITEDQIYEAFGEHGDVQSVRLVTDRETGAPKGFGYVQFGDVEQATAALNALNGQAIAGRPIRVDYAPPKRNDGERGGFGGGRGGGGRGGGRGGRGGFGGDRGGRGGGRGGFGGDRGRGGGRGRGGPPRGGARTGGIVKAEGSKVTFD
ncbi:hypothetical protein I302_103289 [Kwoniella bestiolae CBS 10118]|uniref:Nucleolin n=1 Tax=Kwoniella bestiolae CBS 10118 TaxID=1296100 RepID=A0A1B9G823_9TREE|nr:nucleolin [Kwoniella bestiolae CBS 10118]OCF27153.1 nucleolin [Kwoniella bestiolae CBS 10118]